MASQLDQLLAYLERPGVSEVVLSVGKPISMQTQKGVMNVTARLLSAEQLANIVRGTPIEALIADDSETVPVELKFGARSARVHIERGEDTIVRLQRIVVTPPPETAMTAEEAPEKPRRSRPPTNRPKRASQQVEAQTAPPIDDFFAPVRPSRPSMPDIGDLTLGDLPEPEPVRPRAATSPKGPPSLDFDPTAPSQAFDLALPSSRPKSATTSPPLRINVGAPKDPSESSGIIPLDRPPPVPLIGEARTLQALGLPADILQHVSRERQLVLITAPHGHGKTSTLAALLDRVDRAAVSNVVTVDELRDREAVDLALTAAEGGYLVLATIAAPSAQAAIDILLDHFPGMAHGRVRTRLIASVGVVIAKRLPPTPTEIVTGAGLKALLGA